MLNCQKKNKIKFYIKNESLIYKNWEYPKKII